MEFCLHAARCPRGASLYAKGVNLLLSYSCSYFDKMTKKNLGKAEVNKEPNKSYRVKINFKILLFIKSLPYFVRILKLANQLPAAALKITRLNKSDSCRNGCNKPRLVYG